MTSIAAIYGPLLAVWVALLTLTSLVLREFGMARLKRYPLTLALLTMTLMSLPAGAALKLSRPYQRKILATIIRTKSPAITLPAGCSVFPPDNVWNTRIDRLPVDARSSAYVRSIGQSTALHADFGIRSGYRFNVASENDPLLDVAFVDSPAESDRGPYRIPANAIVEEGGDRHALIVDPGACRLYELFSARREQGQWVAGSGAIFDLRSNQLRPKGWTSADAAGLPLLAGLARYEEVAAGEIRHALRFTAPRTQKAFVWPARHHASPSPNPDLAPMGQRFRLRASFDIAGFDPQAQVILTALKRYGMILSDNGGAWFLSGTQDGRWNSQLSRDLARVLGSDLEAVDSSGLMISPDSGQSRQP